MALTQVSTNGIKDATIATADIADDAVTLAKMAGGTDGQIITYDASGNPVAVGPGPDGQVLTSTGAGSPPAFEDAASGVGGATGVDFNDSVKIRLGTGNDLEIYHDGSHSYLKNSTGNFKFNAAGFEFGNAAANENIIVATEDGAVELYYDNSKKFETANSGLLGADNCRVMLGTGSDLQLWHDGSDSIIDNTLGTGYFYIRGDALKIQSSQSTPETYVFCSANAGVELYYNDIKQFVTKSDGIEVIPDVEGGDALIYLTADQGDDDVDKWRLRSSIYGSGHFQFYNGSDWSDSIKAVNGGTVELYHNGTTQLLTTSDGIEIKPNVEGSNAVLYLTADQGDDNLDKWAIKAASDGTIYHQSYTSGSFVTKFETRAGGDIKVNNGNILMGTAGTGINFSATSDGSGASNVNEVLKDYEEGTFTPTIRHTTDATGATDGVGSYTKVGDMVTCNIAFINKTASSIPNGTVAEITGLPFTANHPTGQADGFSTCTKPIEMSIAQRNGGLWHTVNGTSKLNAHYMNNNSTWRSWYIDDFNNNSLYLIFNITYWTDS